MNELSDLHVKVLDFANTHDINVRTSGGAVLDQIADEFDGMSATRYYQLLNAVLDEPAAEAAHPVLVHRLRRIRDHNWASVNVG